LGTVHFPISCSPEAQRQFDRAVAMLHSFCYPETIKAFTAIATAEPSCAMAYWGVAISQRPNPLVAPFPPEVLRQGLAIEKARAAHATTRRERDWIDALAVFFQDLCAQLHQRQSRRVLAGAAVRAVVVRVIDVSEAIGLELGEFHVATLPRPACG
jgi:hypothetical protein